jgi:hypothetical protein
MSTPTRSTPARRISSLTTCIRVAVFAASIRTAIKFKIGALLEFLSVSVVAAKMKPTIKVSGGELHRIVDRAEQELARSGKYYQRGGLITSISVDPATGESQIIPTSKPAMTRALSCAAVWQRYDKRSDEWVMCDPPERHCIVLFDAQTYAHMPPLAGIARQPYMRSSGHIVSTAGYDTDSAMFGVFDARQFSIPDSPWQGRCGGGAGALVRSAQ